MLFVVFLTYFLPCSSSPLRFLSWALCLFLRGFRVHSLMPLLPEGSSCYIPWLGRWCLSSMLTPVSLVRLHFSGRIFFFLFACFTCFASLLLAALFILRWFVFHYRYRDLLSSFSLCFPFSFGNFIGFFGSSFGTLTLSGLSSTSCFCLFSYQVFCITCASFWFSRFLGFPSGFLGHYRLSSPSSTAVHFYHLSCSPLGSFPRLSSSSTPFRVFFCLPRLPGSFALALLSFHQFI